MTTISIQPLANAQKMVSSPCSFVCATTYYLFSLDLITLIVEDSVHEKPSSADVKQIVEVVGFSTCVIL